MSSPNPSRRRRERGARRSVEEILSPIASSLPTGVDVSQIPAEEFDRTDLRLLNQKLLDKVDELAQSNVERSRLLAHLVKAQELERGRIASDIHDDSIQAMAAAALRLELLGQDLAESEHKEAVGEAARNVRHAVGRLRRLIFDLSPRSLESGGLGAAIDEYLRELGADTDFRWTVEDRLRSHLPDEVDAILYRIAQEAIRNAQKHAQARTLTVTLSERDGGSVLRIADDGVGFAAGGRREDRPGHLGLSSMRERAAVAGGTLQLETAPGAGCAIEVWVPDAVHGGSP